MCIRDSLRGGAAVDVAQQPTGAGGVDDPGVPPVREYEPSPGVGVLAPLDLPAAAYFYLSTLFAATLLLSLTVLSQFVLFNAAPALLIITINWWQMRKGYST